MTLSIDGFSEQFLDLFPAFPGIVYRLQGSDSGLVPMWVSRNFTAITGHRSDSIIGAQSWWSELIHPEDRERALGALDTVSRTGTASSQYRLRHGDGSYHHIRDEMRIDVTAADGSTPCFIGTWSDITDCGADIAELRKTQTELVAAIEQSEKADIAKSEFLSVMSHELRTPLNAIIGFSEVILMNAFGPIGSDRYTSYIEDIRNSGKRLLDLVNDLLDVSSLGSSRLNLQNTPVDITRLCKNCIDLVTAQVEHGKLKLDCHIEPCTPSLSSDEQRLKQVLANLLSNAVKFTPEPGKITLWAGTGPSGGVRFEISDTGIGMDKQEQEIALSNFGQVDSKLSRKYEGSGLGLPLAKSFAEAMDGVLHIKSHPGQGTTVIVQFPKSRSVTASGNES